ncbi:MAG: hypothetical protein ACYCZR_12010 [Burkholderiales bacterium]
MKKFHIAIFGIISAVSSLPALAGPNWLVIDQERQDQTHFYKDRCSCPQKNQGLNGKFKHGLTGMHASKKNHAGSSRQS